MKPVFRKCCAYLLLAALIFGALPTQVSGNEGTARDITADTEISGTGYGSFAFLKDGDTDTYHTSGKNATITLNNSAGISGIYLLFDALCGSYTVRSNTGASINAGLSGMYHEYIDLEGAFGFAPTCVTLEFPNGSLRISELYAFSGGDTLPEFVQVWEKPLDGGADLLLFTTHADDDQLFYAGMLPLYAGERGLRVQTVYLTDHRSGPYADRKRVHELLNGLWNVGVTVYPVLGNFPDIYNEDLEICYQQYSDMGITQKAVQSFITEQIRRFKPLVAVGHDIEGEYGHGMHRVYTDCLLKVLSNTKDASFFPESAKKYGTWDIPKLYLHLYEENKITIDYDTPLSSFGGMTAFEVSQKLGYPCHESQQWTWFTPWINGKKDAPITKASQILTFSPCEFGLYRTLVGADIEKNDFFENVITYAEQERLEQEEQERLEQERLEKEKQEQERLEQERLEQERLEQERLELEAKRQQKIVAFSVLGFLIVAVLAVLAVVPHAKKRRREK